MASNNDNNNKYEFIIIGGGIVRIKILIYNENKIIIMDKIFDYKN